MTSEEQKNARRKAMHLLEVMSRTEKGLSDRLRQAGFSEEAVIDAVEYVKSYGYIDDQRYAYSYLSGSADYKSKRKMFQELQRKGVSGEIISNVWEEFQEINDISEREVLKKTILKKCEPESELSEKEMRRLYGFLARRGFAFEDISAVLNELKIKQQPVRLW
ncbi:MAG: regulatory protein RecX [Eubacteriales bacterium]|nr:regulatory protein RecX [Eubacteriales bacterium]